MRTKKTLAPIGTLALALLLAWPVAAGATTRGTTDGGVAYVSGGASAEELQALTAGRDAYSIWITTAALKSGAYLADARARVLDGNRQVVLDVVMDGPWLFAQLPLGAYTIEVTFDRQVQTASTTIHPGDHHQRVFYFRSSAEVSTDREGVVLARPYGGN